MARQQIGDEAVDRSNGEVFAHNGQCTTARMGYYSLISVQKD